MQNLLQKVTSKKKPRDTAHLSHFFKTNCPVLIHIDGKKLISEISQLLFIKSTS